VTYEHVGVTGMIEVALLIRAKEPMWMPSSQPCCNVAWHVIWTPKEWIEFYKMVGHKAPTCRQIVGTALNRLVVQTPVFGLCLTI
jgi:hypothetical protein